MPAAFQQLPSSYRDDSGFIFEKNQTLYRQVNRSFKEHFDHFIKSGCYDYLVSQDLLIPHTNLLENLTGDPHHYLTLKPEKLPFITYPFEWSFDMLRDAALLTLRLATEALRYDLVLRDATPYNIQWRAGKFIFIDTLSFEKFNESPWVAYRQFCETFLGPLLLMHYSRKPLHTLQLAWPDGIPLDITRSMLPLKSRFSFHTGIHIYLHAKISSRQQGNKNPPGKFSKHKLQNLISSLEILVRKLKLPTQSSTWSDYYDEASQRDTYLHEKQRIIRDWLTALQPEIKTGADLGANDGVFSKLLASLNIPVISADFDPYCINRLYQSIKETGEKNIQPIILDITNPSPSIGVNNKERTAFIERLNVDLTLALALVHHLVIGKNIPFPLVVDFFSKITNYLVIEFVPADDEKVQLMLAQKTRTFDDYRQENFESTFLRLFTLEKKEKIPGSQRILYLFKKR